MPLRVLLRGFQSGIPDGQPVTFVEDLPEDVLCTQCTNLAPQLFTDPRGHGYCGSCRSMCLDNGRFQCPVCEAAFEDERLFPDNTIPQKIGMKQVFCPRSLLKDEVKIPFAAFKAHLYGCHCGSDSDKQISLNCANTSTAEGSAAPNLVECPICQQMMPKFEVREHVKACLSKASKMEPSPSQQNATTPHKSEDTFRREQSNVHFPRTSTPVRTTANVLSSSRCSESYVEELEEAPGITSKPFILLSASSKASPKTPPLRRDLHHVIYGRPCEARFRCPACKKDIPAEEVRKHAINCFLWRRKYQEEPEPKPADVYALLNDFKNEVEEIKIQCQEEMEKLTENCAALENFVGACREETKSEILQVNESLMKVHGSLESKITELQSAVRYILDPEFLGRAMVAQSDNSAVKDDYYQLYAETEQVKEDVWKIMERTTRQPSFRFG